MGGATVCRERVPLLGLLSLIYQEQHEAEKLNLYLREIHCEAMFDSAYLFKVVLRFTK